MSAENNTKTVSKKLPPIIIIVAVIIGIAGGVYGIIESIDYLATNQAVGITLLIISLFEIGLMIGLWYMKKWALIIYSVIVIIDIFTGNISLSIIFPIAVIIAGFINFKQFT